MVRIAILGTGNVAWHLFNAFETVDDVKIVQVIGRNTVALKSFEDRMPVITSDFENITEADIFLISVSDDAVAEVSGFLEDKDGLVVHTSGSVPMDALSKHLRRGVFYPVQTFSQERKVDMKSVPLCLEANGHEDLSLLKKLALQISEKVYDVDSLQRQSLHLAAVFVNNFTNHLFHIGKDICGRKELDFKILHPLMQETIDKIKVISASSEGNPERIEEGKTLDNKEGLTSFEAQTGPARRGDTETIATHLEHLKDSDYKKVYEVLSESILNLYRDKNALS